MRVRAPMHGHVSVDMDVFVWVGGWMDGWVSVHLCVYVHVGESAHGCVEGVVHVCEAES